MAVIIKYVVERNGVEVKVFSSKKEADTYDKMLDAADDLKLLIKKCGISELDEPMIEKISLYLAENSQEVNRILKGLKPVSTPEKKTTASPKDDTDNVLPIKAKQQKAPKKDSDPQSQRKGK